MDRSVEVIAKPSPFSVEQIRKTLPFGTTIAGLIYELVPRPQMRAYARVWIDGHPVPAEWWSKVKPKPGHLVEIACAIPQNTGGAPKEANLRSILTIMTSMAGMLVGGFVIGGPVGSIASALISIAGFFLWNALIPIPLAPEYGDIIRPNYSGTSNPIDPYGVIPVVIGRHRVRPLKLAARPYTSTQGDEQFAHMLFLLHRAPARVSSIRIGQTAIEDFPNVQWQVFRSENIDTSIFSNDVTESVVAEVIDGYTVAEHDGGASTIDLGEAIDDDSLAGLIRVFDVEEGEAVDPGDYSVDEATGVLTWTGSGANWPAGVDRYEVAYWPASRAVTRTASAAADAISLEVDFLSGLFGSGNNGGDDFEAAVYFDLRYKWNGTTDAALVDFLAFGERRETIDYFGDAEELETARIPIERVVRIRDITGSVLGTDAEGNAKYDPDNPPFRDLDPSEYVVDLLNGTITRTDEEPWGPPPFRYVNRSHRAVPIGRNIGLPYFPLEPDSDVLVERYVLGAWIPIVGYSIDYENGFLHYDGLLDFWPVGDWLNEVPPYRVTYRAAVSGSQAPYRWRVVYDYNPLAGVAVSVGTALIRGWLESATARINAITSAISGVASGNRKSTSGFKAQALAAITRCMERVPLIDPTGEDSELQTIIDDLVDLNGNDDGLGALRILLDDYATVTNPGDSLVYAQNDEMSLVLSMIDCLVSMYIYIDQIEEDDYTTRAPMYPEAQKFAHLQKALDPYFDGPFFEDTAFSFRDTQRSIVRRTIHWHTFPAIYDVSIQRLPGPNGPNVPPIDDEDNEYTTEATLGYLRAHGNKPTVSDEGILLLAVVMNTSERLTGIIDDVNCIIEPMVPVWHSDAERWIVETTRNPAWYYINVLLGGANARPVQDAWPTWNGESWDRSRLHMDSLIQWGELADENEWRVDYVFDRAVTVLSALRLIANAGRAARANPDSLFGVVLDIDQTEIGPATIFTPRNVRNLEVSIAYVRKPHALKVGFKNEAADYQDDEVIVYDDGYNLDGTTEVEIEELDGGETTLTITRGPIDEAGGGVDSIVDLDDDSVVDPGDYSVDYETGVITIDVGTWGAGEARWRVTYYAARIEATEFEQIDLPGITEVDAAWKRGRVLMATARLRPRRITFTTDYEHLRCQRGSMVHIQHYVMLTGLHSGARVTAIDPETATEDLDGGALGLVCSTEFDPEFGVLAVYDTVAAGTIDPSEYIVTPESGLVTRLDETAWGAGVERWQVIYVPADYDVLGISVDDYFAMEAGKSYAVEVRYSDSFVHKVGVETEESDTVEDLIFTEGAPASPGGKRIAVGDLVAFGEADRVTRAITILEISKGDYLEARLIAVDHAPEIHTADTTPIPEFDPTITEPRPDLLYFPDPPDVALVTSNEDALVRIGDRFVPRIRIELRPPAVNVGDTQRPLLLEMEWRRFSTDGNGTWTRSAPLAATSLQVYISDVVEGAGYDIRLRYQSDLGRLSDWALINEHVVIGQSTPPRDVTTFYLDPNRRLVWTYPNPPVDLRGYQIRYIPYSDIAYPGTLWDGAPSLHGGLLTALEYVLPDWLSGEMIFLIKAVDFAGNESLNPGVLRADLGEANERNIVFEQDEHADGFDGTIALGEVEDATGDLVGGYSPEDLFWGDDDDPFWGPDDEPFWLSEYTGFDYSFDIEAPSGSTGSAMILQYAATLPPGMSVIVTYTDGEIPETIWPGNIAVTAGTTYTFRIYTATEITTPILIQPRLSSLTAIIDVPDIRESFASLTITTAGDGLRLPVTKAYNAIKIVRFTIEQVPGTRAVGMRVIDYEIPPDEIGPLVKAYDGDEAETTATFRADIEGY